MAGPVKNQILIPFHFGTELDLIPFREGNWTTLTDRTISKRLKKTSDRNPELVVSGDCMAAIAAHRNNMPLVWMDAHGDFHNLHTTETGNLGGMPLAMLCGIGDLSLLHACKIAPVFDVHHVGGSMWDKGEKERMLDAGVKLHNTIFRWSCKEKVHLHIDIDVVSSVDVPSQFHPSSMGLERNWFLKQVDLLLPHTEVLSIKAYDPRKDIGGQGEALVMEIIKRFYDTRNT